MPRINNLQIMEIKYNNSQIEFHKKELESFLKADKECAKITILEKTEALYGGENTIDKEWCDKNNIPYSQGELIQFTGCIIAVKGNLTLDIKKKSYGGEAAGDKFSKALCEYLKRKGLNTVRQDNNDVLVDDYKVASCAEVSLPDGYEYIAYQISINQDLNAIKHACLKPMVKAPKGLGEYGITTEEMVEFCKDYWSKN